MFVVNRIAVIEGIRKNVRKQLASINYILFPPGNRIVQFESALLQITVITTKLYILLNLILQYS